MDALCVYIVYLKDIYPIRKFGLKIRLSIRKTSTLRRSFSSRAVLLYIRSEIKDFRRIKNNYFIEWRPKMAGIVYIVIALVGVMFTAASLVSLKSENE